jgi:hypothetical protein
MINHSMPIQKKTITHLDMSARRRSTLSPIGRPSAVSIYSATLDLNDEDDRNSLSRYFSAIYLHKVDVYHILERQEGRRTLIYHLIVFVLTLISLVFGSITTIDEWRPTLNTPLYYSELILCILFTYELILRIWSAGCLAKYRTWIGRLMFLTRAVIVIDILTLLGFVLSLATGLTTGEFPELTLKFLPPLQMIRFLRVDRQLSSWRILKGIILTHRQEITVTIVIGFMFLIIGAYLVYIAEAPLDPKLNEGPFKSMADSMWFSIITVIFFGASSETLTRIRRVEYPTRWALRLTATRMKCLM